MFWWGLLLVACGVFMLVYGSMLFRFALAVAGFVLGFALGMWLTQSQATSVQVVVAFVAGGVVAALLYFLVSISLYIAGGILGAVAALVILSLLQFEGPILNVIIILVGAGLVGFFGRNLGRWVTILATTLTGAYAVVYGLTAMFPEATGGEADQSAQIPFTGAAFAVFLTVLAIGVLAQWQIGQVRDRYTNRPGPG